MADVVQLEEAETIFDLYDTNGSAPAPNLWEQSPLAGRRWIHG